MVPSNKCLQSSAAPHDALTPLPSASSSISGASLDSNLGSHPLCRLTAISILGACHACDGGSEPGRLVVGGVCFSVWLFGRWKQVLCIYLGSLTNALRDVQYIRSIL